MKIQVQSPTRVDLAGGTLDLWPMYCIVDQCRTINCSINIYTSVEIEKRQDEKIILNIQDLDYTVAFDNYKDFIQNESAESLMIRVVAEYFGPVGGYNITTSSQSPVGGGLGGSSSLFISLIKAFCELAGHSMDLYEQVNLAQNFEARLLGKPTGCQDYFPAANIGLNLIRLGFEGPQVETIEFPEDYFNARYFLVDTGKAHNSGINNWNVYQAVIDGDTDVIRSLQSISNVAQEVEEALRESRWEDLPELYNKEFTHRVQLADCFSSPEIEKLREISISAGADAVKICGAGGGGCVLVITPPDRKQEVMNSCRNQQFQPLEIQFLPS